MKITIDKVIGKKKYKFEIDESDFYESYKKAATLDMLPEKCDACGSEELFLTFRKPKGFNYPGISCRKCKASSSIQGKQDGSEYFIKPMETYKGSPNSNQPIEEDLDPQNHKNGDEVPF